MAFVVIIVWLIAALMCMMNVSGWALGHTYDYLNRCKTYHGTKALGWGTLLVIMYYTPWEKWGIL